MNERPNKKGGMKEEPDAALAPFVTRQSANTTHSYGMTIGNTPKFIWFRVAKVGTRTTLSTLDRLGTTYHLREGFSFAYDAKALEGYFKFAFVRNPWDRIVSCWYHKIVRANKKDPNRKRIPGFANTTGEFEEFVSFLETRDLATCNIHFRLQTRLVPIDDIDFLGRFERFETDLNTVLGHLGIPSDAPLERINWSVSKRPYQDYYTDDLRNRIAALYQPDIKAFGYNFD
jgi:hypothetical protein